MRTSSVYNKYLTEFNLKKLRDKYEFNGTLAYQDFFTLIGMDHVDLFCPLNCSWNRQLDESAAGDDKFSAIFRIFHQCDEAINIFHANGGSDFPDID